MSKFGKDELGTRMKENYENRAKTSLMRRCPVAIRVDGKAFHTFTEGFDLPFDDLFRGTMKDTMKYLCEHIQGCVFGYTQSDEITLILADYQNLDTSAWFDYEVQKVCSIAASMATMAFNLSFQKRVDDFINKADNGKLEGMGEQKVRDLIGVYSYACHTGAMFDARCFNIPEAEVTNLIYWRQLDASKNSVSQAARTYFSHKELEGKNSSERQDMLMTRKGINWNDYPTEYKRGSACVKEDGKWVVDTEIPIFKGEGRDYVEKRIHFDAEEKREEEEAAKLRKVLEDAGKGGKETPPHGHILPYSDGSMKTFSFRSEDWKRATEIYLDGIWHFMKDDPALMTRRSVVILDKKKEDMVILAKTAARGLFHLYDVSMEEMQKRILDAFGKMETFKGYIEVVPGSYSSINEEEGCVLVSLDLDKFEGDYGPILRGESLEMEKEEEEEMDR